MTEVAVSIVRWVDDEPQPGIVECRLTDRFGKSWTILEKCAVVSAATLSQDSVYPQRAEVACRVIGSGCDGSGRNYTVIDTEQPWGIEAADGTTIFEVFTDQLS